MINNLYTSFLHRQWKLSLAWQKYHKKFGDFNLKREWNLLKATHKALHNPYWPSFLKLNVFHHERCLRSSSSIQLERSWINLSMMRCYTWLSDFGPLHQTSPKKKKLFICFHLVRPQPYIVDFPCRGADATWLLYEPFLLDLSFVNHTKSPLPAVFHVRWTRAQARQRNGLTETAF